MNELSTLFTPWVMIAILVVPFIMVFADMLKDTIAELKKRN